MAFSDIFILKAFWGHTSHGFLHGWDDGWSAHRIFGIAWGVIRGGDLMHACRIL